MKLNVGSAQDGFSTAWGSSCSQFSVIASSHYLENLGHLIYLQLVYFHLIYLELWKLVIPEASAKFHYVKMHNVDFKCRLCFTVKALPV